MGTFLQESISRDGPLRPRTLRGFEHVKHYWNSTHGKYTVRVLPGEYYVSAGDEVIMTVLGSCVSACIRDPVAGIGGMNHFMLPEGAAPGPGESGLLSEPARYGAYAMEHIINTILANGGRREQLEIKLFGGAGVLRTMSDVGVCNINFVHDYLSTENLPVVAEDLGGLHPRKLLYFPATGRARVRKLPGSGENDVSRLELEYRRSLLQKPVSGEIDLF
jgi:chemotaxis protein CheD